MHFSNSMLLMTTLTAGSAVARLHGLDRRHAHPQLDIDVPAVQAQCPSVSKRSGSRDWDYIGNIGSPWGSNIIRVEEDVASEYKHVIRFENDNAKAWTVVMWNSYGPSGGLNGFWSPNSALSFTVEPG